MKVAVKKFKSGERYVFLLGEDGVPDFWVAHFVTKKLRSNVVDMGQFHLSKTQDMPTIGKSQYISRVAHITEFLHFIWKERYAKLEWTFNTH